MREMCVGDGRCVECDGVISNPICPSCLALKMRLWVGEVRADMAEDIDGFELPGEVQCLFCGKGMSICAHCFSKGIYEQLVGKDRAVAQEFLSRFDFDLRKEILA